MFTNIFENNYEHINDNKCVKKHSYVFLVHLFIVYDGGTRTALITT